MAHLVGYTVGRARPFAGVEAGSARAHAHRLRHQRELVGRAPAAWRCGCWPARELSRLFLALTGSRQAPGGVQVRVASFLVTDHEAIPCSRGAQGRRLVRRARLAERDGRIAVVRDVPMEECTTCGELWLADHLAERLDGYFMRMLDAAEFSDACWEDSRS